MNGKKRLVLSLVLAMLMALFVTSAALAFDCNNSNINDNAVVGTFDIATETFTPNKTNWGSFDKPHGAWVKLVFPWGDSFNVFVKFEFNPEKGKFGVLPGGALGSGPGENLCDGKGIDSLEACLAMSPP